MKKTYLTILSIAFALFSQSCTLDEKAYQADESYVIGEDIAEALLLGIYDKLGTDGIYRQNLSFVFALPNDVGQIGSDVLTARKAESCNAFATTSPYVEDTWAGLYSAIYDANYFIELMEEKIPQFSQTDQEKCTYYQAEAKALRGLLYFELVRWFGNVPLVLSSAESYKAPEEFKQAAPADVYVQIEKDLKDALILPFENEDKVRDDNAFRISKGGVLGLLAKVYATWAGYPVLDESKWELAAKTAEELITNGPHGLLKDFDQLWHNSGSNKWDPKESLLELSYWSPLATQESGGRVGVVNGIRCQSGGLRNGKHNYQVLYTIHPSFLTEWKDYQKDERFSISWSDAYYMAKGKSISGKVPFLEAWHNYDRESNRRFEYSYLLTNGKWNTEIYVPDSNYQVNNNFTNVNWYLLRYSDVLLLYAEALNEWKKAPTPEAFEAVNMVRRRGFGLDCTTPSEDADLDSSLDYEAFRQAVRNERAWELVGEGHRRQDLVRWGIYHESIMNTYEQLNDWYINAQRYFLGAKYTQKDKHELLPIPQREVDLCGYKQNQGWY